jgi:hypothetical protein
MRATKIGAGVNESERELFRICRSSFLSLWCFPALFNDRSKSSDGLGQELCDLLVVFGDDVLIFSDKNCEFPSSGNLTTDWARWKRRSIDRSANQTKGAARWIREFPHRIFVDRRCTEPLPITLPQSDTMRIHRIVVTHQSARRCKEHFGTGSGSPIVVSMGAAMGETAAMSEAFVLGSPIFGGEFVHVFDSVSLGMLLSELDTAVDFIRYLDARRAFLSSPRTHIAAGEEDLFSFYLHHHVRTGETTFDFLAEDFEDANVFCEEGSWDAFRTMPEYLKWQADKEVSYAWDRLIELFAGQILSGVVAFTNRPNLKDQERMFRILARETRHRRKSLSTSLLSFVHTCDPSLMNIRAVPNRTSDETFYIFFGRSNQANVPYDFFRQTRKTELYEICLAAKHYHPKAGFIVGIATEAGGEGTVRSEEILVLDARHWPKKAALECAEVAQRTGYLSRPRIRRVPAALNERTAHNYAFDPLPINTGRNERCPCGSGKKFKRCCRRQESQN